MALPQVRLVLNGPQSIRIGESNSYSIQATNESIENLNGLLVRIGIPQGVSIDDTLTQAGSIEIEPEADGSRSVIWQVPRIEAGTTQDMRITLQTSQPKHFALDVEWTAMPLAGQLKVDVEQPALLIALEGASEAVFGEAKLYRLRIKNPGNADARDVAVQLTAAEFGSNETNIGDVPAGSERIVEVELTFQEMGAIQILATATSEQSDLVANTSIDVKVLAAELVAEWTGPSKFYQGSVARYDLKVSNRGTATSERVECTVSLPEGLEPVAVPDGAYFTGGNLTWSIDELDVSADQTFTLRLRMTTGGDQRLAFTARGSAGGKTDAELLTQVEAITDLKLTVVDPIAPAPTNSQVEYEVVIVNRGSKPAKNVQVIAQFSQGIEPVNATGQAHRLIPGQVLFEPIDLIGSGESVTLQIIAKASVDGTHRFRAQVTCDEDETQLVHEESTRYLATSASTTNR